MMQIFYNLSFILFGLIYLPIFLLKIRQAENPGLLMKQRLGILPSSWKEKFESKEIIWIHAVSVGEVMAIEKFIDHWLHLNKTHHLVLTTVTPTGQRVAKRLERPRLTVCYFPFDLSFSVSRFFKILKPLCLLLVETEMWPNLITEAARFGVPVGMVNGRLSERSVKRYKKASLFLKSLWKKIAFVLAQSMEDSKRFQELGIEPSSIHEMGNMKFDQVEWVENSEEKKKTLRQVWNLEPGDIVWIAGSTHPGEEEVTLRIFSKLRESFSSLKLILAPRHIERSRDLCLKFKKGPFAVKLASEEIQAGAFDVLILDQLGVLRDLYRVADLVFVGGSLVSHGGQNPIEAARFKKAILYGPHVFHFKKIYEALEKAKGAVQVAGEEELYAQAKRFLNDTPKRLATGEKAYQVVSQFRGASRRQAEWILALLEKGRPIERINRDEQNKKLFSSLSRGA